VGKELERKGKIINAFKILVSKYKGKRFELPTTVLKPQSHRHVMTCNMVNGYKCSERTWDLVSSTPKMEAIDSFKNTHGHLRNTCHHTNDIHILLVRTQTSQCSYGFPFTAVDNMPPERGKTQQTLIMALLHLYSNTVAPNSKKGSWYTSRILSYCYIPKDWDRICRHFTRYHGRMRLNYVQHESTFNLASNKTWWDIVSWLWEES